MKYVLCIPHPGNRKGWEIWLGPVGLPLHWPADPWHPMWNWGWWKYWYAKRTRSTR